MPSVPELPSWTTTPSDPASAIAELMAAVRARLVAAGRSVDEVFAVMAERVGAQVGQIAAELEQDKNVWPVVEYADIQARTVPAHAVAALRRRGCLIVRGHFERQQALDWDQGIEDYVGRNRFFEHYRGAGDDFFASVDSKPEIYPIYWSPAQVEARRHSERSLRRAQDTWRRGNAARPRPGRCRGSASDYLVTYWTRPLTRGLVRHCGGAVSAVPARTSTPSRLT
jgi:hypothetical protein